MRGDKRKVIWLLLLALAMLLSTVGLTYAWMAQRASMTTLLTITPPDTITIIPTRKDGSPMTELDLDFNEDIGDKKIGNKIQIYRPVCISSTEEIHRLEIVHTTNLKDLGFKIYPASIQTDENNVVTIQQTSDTPLPGEYKNETSPNSKLAKEEVLENYTSPTDVADRNAYPLYWITDNCPADKSKPETGADQKTYYNTYYMLEISWMDETKETDLFYIMAQNVAE